MDELLGDFVSETLDMMEAVSSQLVAWEANPADRAALDGIFRLIHTVKGSSSFLDLPRITAVAHAAEELLDALRSRQQDPDPACVAIVLDAFDSIRAITLALQKGGNEPAGDDSSLILSILSQVRRDAPERRPDEQDVVANQHNAPLEAPVAAEVTEAADADSIEGVTEPDLQGALKAELVAQPQPVPEPQPEPQPVAAPAPAPAPALAAEATVSTMEGSTLWRSVRVPLPLLDALMSGVSDLVLARNEVAARLRKDGVDVSALAPFERLSNLIASVRGSVSQMRMVPLRNLFSTMPRIARQLSDDLGKRVRIVIEGGEIEIDREVMEALRDPMTHVMRNAIDHGIESPEERAAAGKSQSGTLRISAMQSGNRIVIRVEDDGRGLSIDKLVNRALASERITHDQLESMTMAQKAQLVFLPGLSTADTVTGISGRGVGMDVVKANIERLGGSTNVDSRAGQGMALTIDVPMTLSIVSAIVLTANERGFAIPRSAVHEVLLADSQVVRREEIGGIAMLRLRGRLLPLIKLETALGLPHDASIEDNQRAYVVCRLGSGRPVVLDAPDVRDHEELVIKPLPPALLDLGLYSGLSLPDDGCPMLILDVEGICNDQQIPDLDRIETEDLHAQSDGAANDNQWLRFIGWHDHRPCAIMMRSVLRIIDVPAAAIRSVQGRVVACIDGKIIPVVSADFAAPEMGKVRMIWVEDGRRAVLLPTRDIIGLSDLTIDLPAAGDAPSRLGISLVEDELIELIELIDSHGLLALAGGEMLGAPTAVVAEQRLWVVEQGGSDWGSTFLRPMLAAAGYAVECVASDALVPDGVPRLVLADKNGADARMIDASGAAAAIDVYDRDALFAALKRTATGGVGR